MIPGEPFNSIDLDGLGLSSGEGRHLEVEVETEPLELGGQSYELDLQPTHAKLDVSRSAAGYAMRLRFEDEVVGPCMRCLGDARVPVAVEAREVDHPGTEDEDLRSPYVEDGHLLHASWARDALALALPPKLLCRADCAGLCRVCGESLNDADPADHKHGSGGEVRWEKLRELKLD